MILNNSKMSWKKWTWCNCDLRLGVDKWQYGRRSTTYMYSSVHRCPFSRLLRDKMRNICRTCTIYTVFDHPGRGCCTLWNAWLFLGRERKRRNTTERMRLSLGPPMQFFPRQERQHSRWIRQVLVGMYRVWSRESQVVYSTVGARTVARRPKRISHSRGNARYEPSPLLECRLSKRPSIVLVHFIKHISTL